MESSSPESSKQTEETKTDFESKVAKILKLLKDVGQSKKGKNPEESKKRSEVMSLIEDIQKQHQSLYTRYEHMRVETERKDHGRKEIERSLSTFSAESEYYSSEEVDYGSTVNENSISLDSNKKNPEVVNPEAADTINEADQVSKEVQEKINILKIEAEYLRVMNNGLEVQVKDKKAEAEQLKQNNEQLQVRVFELEIMCKTKEGEASLATPDINELKGQMSNLQIEAESTEVKRLKARIDMMQQELNSLLSHKSELELQLEMRTKDVTENTRQIETLKEEIGRMSVCEKGLLKEKEGLLIRVDSLETELRSLRNEENKLEETVRTKTTEADNLMDENERLNTRIIQLEASLTKRGDGLSIKIPALEEQVKRLQKELDSRLREKREQEIQYEKLKQDYEQNRVEKESEILSLTNKIEDENGILMERGDTVKRLQEELDSVLSKLNELEILNNKSKQDCEQNQAMNESEILNLTSKIEDQKGILAQRCDTIKHLQKELDSVLSKQNELEIRNEGEILNLTSKIEDQTGILRDRDDNIKCLKQELDSVLSKQNELQMQSERFKQDSAKNQAERETQILNLKSKIEEQEKILKERENIIKRLRGENKLVKHHSLDSPKNQTFESPRFRLVESPRLNNQGLERKIEELAEKFQMKMENQIRLLSQRIHIAEQIHTETKDGYKKVKEQLEQENRELDNKKAVYDSELVKLRNILLEPGNSALTGLDLLVKKLDEDNGNFLSRISRISIELQNAKHWVTRQNNEMAKLKREVDVLTVQLKVKQPNVVKRNYDDDDNDDEHDHGHGIDDDDETSRFEKKMRDLEEQIEDNSELFLSLSKEKREAIWQLCVLVDYHRIRYDHLKEAIINKTIITRTRRAA